MSSLITGYGVMLVRVLCYRLGYSYWIGNPCQTSLQSDCFPWKHLVLQEKDGDILLQVFITFSTYLGQWHREFTNKLQNSQIFLTLVFLVGQWIVIRKLSISMNVRQF
jgi:hypothetical protein